MKILSLTTLIFLLAILSIPLFAQIDKTPIVIPSNVSKQHIDKTITDKAKVDKQRKDVAEEILIDAEKLENNIFKAISLSYAGKLLCKIDNERAVLIFHKSIKELILAQDKVGLSVINDSKNESSIFNHRSMVISEISKCDSELAYKLLYTSRSPQLSRLLKDYYIAPSSAEKKYLGWIRQEKMRETNLKRDIIRKNNKRALEFINDDLEKMITSQTIDSLKTLHRTNPSLANQLPAKIIDKLLNENFFSNKQPIQLGYGYSNLQNAITLLRTLGRDEKSNRITLQVSDQLLASLAYKIINESIQNEYISIDKYSLEVIEKFYPNKIVEFEQMKANQLKKSEALESQRFEKFTKSNPSIESLISSTKDFTEPFQNRIYQSAACKLVDENMINKAKMVFDLSYSDKFYSDAKLSMIIYSNAVKKWESGEYQQAEELIKQIPNLQLQIDAYSSLAEIIYEKKKDTEKPLLLLLNAKQIVKQNLQNIIYTEAMVDIITVYALVAPEKAFLMFDKLLNETDFTDKRQISNETFGKYNDIGLDAYFGVKNGFNYRDIVTRLQNNSFEKTLKIINKKKHPYLRIQSKRHLFEKGNNFYSDNVKSYCN